MDFFTDIVGLLRDLVRSHLADLVGDGTVATTAHGPAAAGNEPRPVVSREMALSCVAAAFAILDGQEDAIEVDLSAFHAALYATLPMVPFTTSDRCWALHAQPWTLRLRPAPHCPLTGRPGRAPLRVGDVCVPVLTTPCRRAQARAAGAALSRRGGQTAPERAQRRTAT